MAHCAPCGRDVLTHVTLEGRGAPRCVHCDAEIDPSDVRWIDESALDPLGYAVRGDDDAVGCGRPGCGRGNCANRR